MKKVVVCGRIESLAFDVISSCALEDKESESLKPEPIVITNPYKESMINPWKIKLTRKERRALERKNKR